ncbi:MAG: DMT family transporter [Phyllobacterium sp.]
MLLTMTGVAMIAFAANSLLARVALSDTAIDAASYTAIRLVSGAMALAMLLAAQRRTKATTGLRGNWPSAFALFFYAVAFSFAYLRLGAATGALILFSAVQGTMIAHGLLHRDQPTPAELFGLAIAFCAFVYLLLPGLHAPDAFGSLLMIVAGIAWGAYSLRGRGVTEPLAETAGNFARTAPICLFLLPFSFVQGHVTAKGILLAVASGVVASGLGYAIWYRALPHLSTTQAAVVQLTVPVIAAFGAAVFLSEVITLRLALASLFILGGVGLAILSRRRSGFKSRP